jgi:phosphoribosylamine-glycine ligase
MSKLKWLVYDLGLFTEQALRLLRDSASVKYFVNWADAFPEATKAKIGEGLDGLERVEWFWDEVDKCDAIFIPDTHCQDITEFLKSKGYPVAGAGRSERIELDRWYGRNLQVKNGLPVQETHKIVGVTDLKEFLTNHKNYFVKIDTFRGVTESFRHYDWKDTEGEIEYLIHKVGPYKEDVVFTVEELIDGIEPGFDGITFDGETLYPTMCGYEMKGAGYISRTYKNEGELPAPLKQVNDGLSPEFKKNKTRFFVSTEIKLTKDKVPFLIDPTIRLAAPGTSAVQTEIIENYTDVVYGLATGNKVDPIIKYKYGAAVCFQSARADKRWVNVTFPKQDRQWIKFRMGTKKGNDYYACPGFDSICTVIGLGNTIPEAVDLVKERSKGVHAAGLDPDTSGLDEIVKKIQEGKPLGVNF